MLVVAMKCALVYWLLQACSLTFMLEVLTRPIVAAFVMGVVLGDVKTALIMGAQLEAIFLGTMVIGSVTPSDSTSGTICAVCFVILTGIDMEVGVALAYPIGTLINTINSLISKKKAVEEPWWKKMVDEGKIDKFNLAQVIYGYTWNLAPKTIILFFCLWLGTEAISASYSFIPAWITGGIAASGYCLTAVGLGITLSLIWSKELGGFFFIGFLLFKVAGLSVLEIAIIGTALAVAYFYNDQKIAKISKIAMEKENEEDGEFF